MNKGMNMNLRVAIGRLTVNTTPAGLSKVFQPEDSNILQDMFNVYPILNPGSSISQFTNGVRYEIFCTK